MRKLYCQEGGIIGLEVFTEWRVVDEDQNSMVITSENNGSEVYLCLMNSESMTKTDGGKAPNSHQSNWYVTVLVDGAISTVNTKAPVTIIGNDIQQTICLDGLVSDPIENYIPLNR